jgi:SAM-dependent methyltransferase
MSETSIWKRIEAVVYDPFLWLGERSGMASRRRAVLAAARGRVLEIGAGTGLNLSHYPAGIDELVLTEPVEPIARALERRVALRRLAAKVHRSPAEHLPFPDRSFDTVVSTLVLCTVDDPVAAVAEVRRVLRPGGQLLFIEHVRAENGRRARWQDRLVRPWAAVAAGCHCNRRTLELLEGGGLGVVDVARGVWRGMPPLVRPLAAGRAVA